MHPCNHSSLSSRFRTFQASQNLSSPCPTMSLRGSTLSPSILPGVTPVSKTIHPFLPMTESPVDHHPPLPPPVPGLQTQLLVEVTGLGFRGDPRDLRSHFSHVVLRGIPEGAERGRVPLEPMGPRERGLLAASLPPALLSTTGPFSLELIGQDGEGHGLHRVAPQPCTVVPVLLEVRCQRKVRVGPEGAAAALP